jgi:hypothetical protein
MALRQTIQDYGGPYQDQEPVENPQVQISAGFDNRALEDQAQMTRTSDHAKIRFDTIAGAPATLPPSSVTHHSQWGSGDAQKPVVEKIADPGVYSVTYAAAFVDSLGVSETVSFFDARVSVRTGDAADALDAVVLAVASNVIVVATYSPPGTLADAGNSSALPLTVVVRAD